MFHVYVLRRTKTGRRYVRSCENVQERLERHNNGNLKRQGSSPWVLVHGESFPSRAKAVRRELYFKTGRGRDELARLLS